MFRLGLLLLLSLVILTYRLGEIPALHGDEGATGVQALYLLQQDEINPFKIGWAEQPLLTFMFPALTLKFFGPNVFALRLGSIIFGLVSVLAFYLLARLYFSSLIATTISLFYLFSHWFIAISRLGTSYIQIVPLMLFSFYFLFLGLKQKRAPWFFISGAAASSCSYLYHAGRVVFPAIFIFILILFLLKKIRLSFLTTFIFAGFLFLVPFSLIYYQAPETVFVRTRDVLPFNNLNPALWPTLKVFIFGGDNSEQYGYQGPLIPLLFLPLFVAGFFLALAKIKKPFVFFTCYWFLLMIFLVSLTVGPSPPFAPRLTPILPIIFLFLGYALSAIKMKRKTGLLAMSLLTVFWALINIKIYFWDYAHSLFAGWANYEPAPKVGTYLRVLGNEWTALFFDAWPYYGTQGNVDFLAREVFRLGGLTLEQGIYKAKKGEKTVFVFFPYAVAEQRSWWEAKRHGKEAILPAKVDIVGQIALLQQEFPHGAYREFFRQDGSLLFVSYEVSK